MVCRKQTRKARLLGTLEAKRLEQIEERLAALGSAAPLSHLYLQKWGLNKLEKLRASSAEFLDPRLRTRRVQRDKPGRVAQRHPRLFSWNPGGSRLRPQELLTPQTRLIPDPEQPNPFSATGMGVPGQMSFAIPHLRGGLGTDEILGSLHTRRTNEHSIVVISHLALGLARLRLSIQSQARFPGCRSQHRRSGNGWSCRHSRTRNGRGSAGTGRGARRLLGTCR